MASIHLKTEIPGPRSLALWERRKAAVARGLTTLHPVFLERGEGAAVTDVDGNRLLDFTGGIGALNVGHARPEIAQAVSDQVARLTHTAIQVTGYEPYVALAEKLCAIAPINGPRKAFLVTTGTEAVENAVKLSRVASGRSAVVCFEHAFHGRSLGALSFTSRARPYKFGMGPFLPEVYRLPYPTFYRWGLTPADALAAARLRLAEFFRTVVAPEQVACLIIEPVLGEGGFLVPPPGYLEFLREETQKHGIALVIDEVQSGFCRTGRMFAIEHTKVQADLVCIGESHDNELHHRVQLQIIKALFARDERLGVGLEMFQRPYQGVLDRYLRGDLAEADDVRPEAMRDLQIAHVEDEVIDSARCDGPVAHW